MNPVTDPDGSATAASSRNAILEAELEAELEERRSRPAHPDLEEAARLLAGIDGEETDEEREARHAAYWISRTAYCCYTRSCGHVFTDGDVIHLRRLRPEFYGSSWVRVPFCETCVSGFHPSWMEMRTTPIACAGGCGALVSSWGLERFVACSSRCAEITQRERRLVSHEPRACEGCGEEFTPTRSDARYCSGACRQEAYRKRKLVAS